MYRHTYIMKYNKIYILFFLFCFIAQSFIWPLARPATDEEPLIVELRTQTTKTLIRTSLSHASGGWMGGSPATGTITSSSKCVGQYMMLMQGKFLLIYLHINIQA